jgi:tetratricopeptide (TPR) repeat protein
MKKIIILSFVFLACVSSVFSQSADILKTQLDYCKKESAKFEKNLDSYKQLLEIQGGQIMELKTTIQDQESEIKNLKSLNERLESVSIELLELGHSYEEMGNFEEAIQIYKLLMRNYPSSMEAIASRLRVIELKKKPTAKK